MRRFFSSFVVFLVLLDFTAYAQTAADANNINVEELKMRIEENKNLVILDVRKPEELNGPLGKIDGVINIPVQELESRVGELDKYKDKEIAVICRTGHRSAIAARILLEHGFTNVENVEGGMTAFRSDESPY